MRITSLLCAAPLAAGFVVMLAAQTAGLPSFEVATVRPTGHTENVSGLFNFPGGRIRARNLSLKTLIAEAYDVRSFRVTGGPGWVEGDHWNIEAKPLKSTPEKKGTIKEPLSTEQRAMLESLLAERFQLKVHRETKDEPVYYLMKGDRGLEMKPAAKSSEMPWVGGWRGGAILGEGIAGINADMPLMAARLSQYLGRTVLDRTGLTGGYDFRYHYPPEARPDIVESIRASVSGLGLKLESGHDAIEMIVVDHAEKPESADGSRKEIPDKK